MAGIVFVKNAEIRELALGENNQYYNAIFRKEKVICQQLRFIAKNVIKPWMINSSMVQLIQRSFQMVS